MTSSTALPPPLTEINLFSQKSEFSGFPFGQFSFEMSDCFFIIIIIFIIILPAEFRYAILILWIALLFSSQIFLEAVS